jgi:acyl-CoA reductase-like NAD-dependent aldehyde dehydrogenase
MAANKLFPAVITGNCVVLKPSPYTPLSTVMMSEIAAVAFPPGVMNILTGPDSLGKMMVEHPDIHQITFTGSTRTGINIMKTGADTVKKMTMEMGGNDAAIVLPDADPAQVAPQVFQKAMFNTGQVCIAIKRLFVHEDSYDAMVSELAKQAEGAVGMTGDGMAPTTMFGPMNNKMQLERIEMLVADAKAKGGKVVAGGERFFPNGEAGAFFYKPTIVSNVAEGAKVVDEEQFGPVMPVLKYKTVDEAIARANDSEYGLGASVWTADPHGEGVRVANQLDAGMTWINDHLDLHPSVPFGGVKQSGVGREGGGAIGLKEFVEMKTMKVTKVSYGAKPKTMSR